MWIPTFGIRSNKKFLKTISYILSYITDEEEKKQGVLYYNRKCVKQNTGRKILRLLYISIHYTTLYTFQKKKTQKVSYRIVSITCGVYEKNLEPGLKRKINRSDFVRHFIESSKNLFFSLDSYGC